MFRKKLTVAESLEIRNRIFKAFVLRIKRVYKFKQSTFKDAVYGKNPENGGYTYEFLAVHTQCLQLFTVDIPANDNELHIRYNKLYIYPPAESIEDFRNISKKNFYSAEATELQQIISPQKRHGLTPAVHYRLRDSIFAPSLEVQEKELKEILRDKFSMNERAFTLRFIPYANFVDWTGKVISKNLINDDWWYWRRGD